MTPFRIAALGVVVVVFLCGQELRTRFDVVSVKPSLKITYEQAGVHISGTTVLVRQRLGPLVEYAYGLRSFQVPWPAGADNALYEIEGKATGDTPVSVTEARLMLRHVLEDRFQLRYHSESREIAVYALVLSNNKPSKLTASSPDSVFRNVTRGLGGRNAREIVTGATMNDLCVEITRNSGFGFDRPIVDRTGLDGKYDIEFEFTQARLIERSQDPGDIDVRSALQDLRFRLEPQKTMFDMFVIDHIEPPSPN